MEVHASDKQQVFFIVYVAYLSTILNYENSTLLVLSGRLFTVKRFFLEG